MPSINAASTSDLSDSKAAESVGKEACAGELSKILRADRPFTDSEVGFLRYIRQWGKKVVFLVNKVDILASAAEQAEVCAFVGDSAARMLGVQGSQVRLSCVSPAASLSEKDASAQTHQHPVARVAEALLWAFLPPACWHAGFLRVSCNAVSDCASSRVHGRACAQ